MKKIFMPDAARKIIYALEAAGYEAYIVGGCVRDALLGKAPNDYDITTSAFPEQTKALFDRTVDTGIAHGTVTVVIDGEPYEVTTFRIDGEYTDSRHPETVSYTGEIKEDLARRDFTVNALAYNERVGIVDAFGGISDLENGIIRTVREPEARFAEDALRVLRGLRFSSTLGFEIEEKTGNAIRVYANDLEKISVERIYVEWKKLLSGVGAYEIINEYFDVILKFLPELSGLQMPSRERFIELTADERQLVLFALTSGVGGFLSAEKRLKMDGKTRATGATVLNNLTITDEMTDGDMRLYIIGKKDAEIIAAANISHALQRCGKDTVSRILYHLSSDAPRSVADLKIGGFELMEEGITGAAIGKTLSELLRMVARYELPNDKNELIRYLRKEN